MDTIRIAIIGLGYVGLPLAHLFATKYAVVGFDSDTKRIQEIQAGFDRTLELTTDAIQSVLSTRSSHSKGLFCTTQEKDLRDCNYFIITVPTPVDEANKPNLTFLFQASQTVGRNLNAGDIVIYESTVYPGATQEECVPVLENVSNLIYNTDFFVGYSPERINPGDKEHTIEKIIKITSGSTPEIGKKVDALYASVIKAGTHLAPSIKVAEAAKVIENSQRDINIAFVNELAKIFNLMGIDTQDVLKAAGTKWNFLPFKPGLVGGHCIGVDPYYLAHKAQEFSYHPEIILGGRRVNDGMGEYVASEVIRLMVQKDIPIKGSKILILGITFKENCPDVRNTKVIELINRLKRFGAEISISDPWASPAEVLNEYQLHSTKKLPEANFDAIVLAVAHRELINLDLKKLLKDPGVLYDIKGALPIAVDGRL